MRVLRWMLFLPLAVLTLWVVKLLAVSASLVLLDSPIVALLVSAFPAVCLGTACAMLVGQLVASRTHWVPPAVVALFAFGGWITIIASAAMRQEPIMGGLLFVLMYLSGVLCGIIAWFYVQARLLGAEADSEGHTLFGGYSLPPQTISSMIVATLVSGCGRVAKLGFFVTAIGLVFGSAWMSWDATDPVTALVKLVFFPVTYFVAPWFDGTWPWLLMSVILYASAGLTGRNRSE